MNARTLLTWTPVPLGAAAIGIVSLVLAQTGGSYDLSRHAITSGGGALTTGGGMSLDGVVGQAAVGVGSGGTFIVTGGISGAQPAASPSPTATTSPSPSASPSPSVSPTLPVKRYAPEVARDGVQP
jgi:hypothetical protein